MYMNHLSSLYKSLLNRNPNGNEILRFNMAFKNVDFEFIHMENVKKGHLTKMWNILFKKAYDEDCDYFFQCGDDIQFTTKGWVSDCISLLQRNNNIGVSGPINNNARILTQTFVHRKHMEIFNFYFPERIINWCIDDWINLVYKGDYFLQTLYSQFTNIRYD